MLIYSFSHFSQILSTQVGVSFHGPLFQISSFKDDELRYLARDMYAQILFFS